MPGSYGILPASKGHGLLAWEWVTERMERARNYWVSTSGSSGAPHAMPVWGVWVNDSFYFAADRLSRKSRDLMHNPKAVLHLESGDEVVILECNAEEVAGSAELREVAEAYFAKYAIKLELTPEALRTNAVFVLRPTVAYAWEERDFPGTATRWKVS